jgi:hypothetical protein
LERHTWCGYGSEIKGIEKGKYYTKSHELDQQINLYLQGKMINEIDSGGFIWILLNRQLKKKIASLTTLPTNFILKYLQDLERNGE